MKKSSYFKMLKLIITIFALSLILSSMAFAQNGNVGCFVSGGGHIGAEEDGNGNSDNFGVIAAGMWDGSVRGEWQNTTHLDGYNSRFHGQVSFLYCYNDGGPGPDVPQASANHAIFGGSGKWDNDEGYLFIVSAADYKEGKAGEDANTRDTYAITIYQDGNIVYEENDIIFGNFQIHPPNNGHPYVGGVLTDAMEQITTTEDLFPDNNY